MPAPDLIVNQRAIPLDPQGYLENLSDWNPDVAQALAQQDGIELSDAHWELIHLIQGFYREFEHSPANRILVKYVKQHLGEEKGNSLYLLQLFPGSSAKRLAKIAGLPRPTHCL